MAEYSKKLIEVALPLEAINTASAREKSIRHGHPSTLHLWWARRPLAACRAVLFASLVDDPSSHPDRFTTEDAQEAERQRLFRIIEELVTWENSGNQNVLAAARSEIKRSTDGNPPPVFDPFCGGGSIPLEAERLGLEAYASDLNPVAVLITKALTEIPPRFADCAPVHPAARGERLDAGQWKAAHGLAEDVRRYGAWMREQAVERIGHLYPKVVLAPEDGGGEATVIAWLWARSVRCPNPACGAEMPLVRSFWLSKKKSGQAWVEPIVDRADKSVRFEVRTGQGAPRDGTKDRIGARCLYCDTAVANEGLRMQSINYGLGSQLFAIVAEGPRGRIYLPPTDYKPPDVPDLAHEWLDQPMAENPRWFSPPGYGMPDFADLFTPRQVVALTTFSDLVGEARERVLLDAVVAGMVDDRIPLEDGGAAATAYADAVATYLAFAVDKLADYGNTITTWAVTPSGEFARNLFARQAIAMSWDYAEINHLSDSTGNISGALDWVARVLDELPAGPAGTVDQLDATSASRTGPMVVSTDPPYYDNIGYADLSDFFYVWMRHSLGAVFPQLMSTLLVPKASELVATPYRFKGGKREAQAFFERGLGEAFARMKEVHDPRFPLTVYYAFKQSEDEDAGLASTGWETMLEGLLRAGFSILGTWPMRSERLGRTISVGTNALASSIVLVCRPRPATASMSTRGEFLRGLHATLPAALRALQHGNIAPVDLAQAAIGPGMAVFSAHSKVVEADGTAMSVRTGLGLINSVLDEVLSAQEGEYDPSTRWALAWFEQSGYSPGPYGTAEVLATAKAISVQALARDGFLEAAAGRVRLLRREDLPTPWDPATDTRLTVWEITQYLVKALEEQGESRASDLLHAVGPSLGEIARDLAYRLYVLCERKGWAKEALPYNALVVAWPELLRLAGEAAAAGQTQLEM